MATINSRKPKSTKQLTKKEKKIDKLDVSKDDEFKQQAVMIPSSESVQLDNQQQDLFSVQSQYDDNYKIIIAIKSVKDHSNIKQPNIKCTITIQNKSKNVTLPFTEGLFFELSTLSPLDQILVSFTIATASSIEVGTLTIPLDEENVLSKESEIVDEFSFPYQFQNHEHVFSGSFYAIILNKSIFLNDSPTRSKKVKKEVQFKSSMEKLRDKGTQIKNQLTGSSKSSPGGNQMRRQMNVDIDPQDLYNQVEMSVKTAIIELQNAQELEEADVPYSPNKASLSRAQTIQEIEDGSEGINSGNVQIMRQSTKGFDSPKSPQKLQRKQTFNVDDGDSTSRANKSKDQIISPSRHVDSYDHHCHENLTCLYYIDQANLSNQLKIQNDYLKKVIYALDKKNKALSTAEEYNKKFSDDLRENEEERLKINDILSKAQKDYEDLKAQIDQDLNEQIILKKQLQNELLLKDQEINRINALMVASHTELNQEKLVKTHLDREIKELKTIIDGIEQMNQKIKAAEDRADTAEKNFQEKMLEIGDLLVQTNKQRQIQDLRAQALNQKLLETQIELENQMIHNEELDQEIKKLQYEMVGMKHRESTMKVLQEQAYAAQKEILDRTNAKFSADQINDQLRKQIQQVHVQHQEKERLFNEKTKELRKQINEHLQNEKINNIEIAEKTKLNLQLKSELKQTQMGSGLTHDIQRQLEEERARSQHYHQTQQDLIVQNQEQSQLIHQMNKQTYSLSQKNQELTEEFGLSESYCQNLKKLICEMQEKDLVCIPYHSDPIDKALANFINSFYDPSRLNGLFVREGEGIYQFGSKKLYIKIEQDKIFIRTGGGFIGIGEFLDLYTPAELEKLQKSGPQVQKVRNETLTNTIEKRGRIVKEIVQPHTAPLKVKTLGAVFTKYNDDC